MRKLQDVLRKHILREALEPVAVVELEKTIALLDEQRADGYCELRPDRPPDSALPHLGLLRRMAELARRYLNVDGSDIAWDLIRTAWASIGIFALAPMQDFLSLGNEARMNFPGRLGGNWTWRMNKNACNNDMAARIREVNFLYSRLADPQKKKKS